ncbi:hypothetical protein BJY17_003221 [Agromyces hippuratus]|uniref:Uncharacterized protein n=1 Tax=Agromyces hippuratus TaxID=286438 RepID=A0A852X4N2_9MICO|nr:hypothetical protein [Agromyces hippuratus]NYG22474.1 hypothetical protein [Agromyces hippuratus]
MNRWALISVGAIAGLAWAGALRAWMAELSGSISAFSWGTFVGVLLPGLIVGAAIGWASTVGPAASARERRMLRWCAASPFAFAIAPMLIPGGLVGLLTQGLGGGAVLIALIAIGGGYAFGGGRPMWARAICGVLAIGVSIAVALMLGSMMRGAALALTTPRGAWLAVLDLALMLTLIAAASVPFRKLSAIRSLELAGRERHASSTNTNTPTSSADPVTETS